MNIEEIVKSLSYSGLLWEVLTPLLFSLGDIITGYVQAVINHDVDSKKMRNGLLHKFLIIICLFLAYIFGLSFNLLAISRIISIYIVLMEIMSILENMKKAGIDVGKLTNILK